ncbi:MAG: hypothetical protein WA824_09920 [Candidatus Sulfotelmatobacter sp.]
MPKLKVRFWLEILVVIGGIACVLAVFFTSVGAANGGADENSAAVQSAQGPIGPTQSFDGVITDTHCGAKHTPAIAESAADCTLACVHSGEQFALVDGDKMYVLKGQPKLLKRGAGERVTLRGTLSGNTISVASVRLPAP